MFGSSVSVQTCCNRRCSNELEREAKAAVWLPEVAERRGGETNGSCQLRHRARRQIVGRPARWEGQREIFEKGIGVRIGSGGRLHGAIHHGPWGRERGG